MNMFERIASIPSVEDLEYCLGLTDQEELQLLFGHADRLRQEHCGNGILLRGLIEFSNHCRNTCFYCGLNKHNKALERYRLSEREIIDSVKQLYACGIRTVVLQSGEDEKLNPLWMEYLIVEIKSRFPGIAVTLSVGERSRQDYADWKRAGADRYLLKIETSNKKLYESLHTDMSFDNRLRCLKDLKELGYQVGSGIMVGLKGQTLRDIARDILFFKDNEFDMIGIGPFIPHKKTRLADQKHGDVQLVLKTVALTRMVTKYAHLPATTALGSLGDDYRVWGLRAGANVLMPNFTPQPYRRLYEIYPGKRCIDEPSGSCSSCMELMADSIGRTIDYSRGDTLVKY